MSIANLLTRCHTSIQSLLFWLKEFAKKKTSKVYIKTNGDCSLDIEAQSVFNSLSSITESNNTKGSCLFFSYGKK